MSGKRLIVFTGAGISAESGIRTFRDAGGIWEEYRIEDVATYEAWLRDRKLVLDFYNERRKQVMAAQPNAAHLLIAELEKYFEVQVITQNVDDLHERAGSSNVLHLHGEIMKARSSIDPSLVYPLESWELKMGMQCEKGSQLRPHIVWFGELVPDMDRAVELARQADLFLVIGTSLNVYPAAGLLNIIPPQVPSWLVDPSDFHLEYVKQLIHVKKTAVQGVDELRASLLRHVEL